MSFLSLLRARIFALLVLVLLRVLVGLPLAALAALATPLLNRLELIEELFLLGGFLFGLSLALPLGLGLPRRVEWRIWAPFFRLPPPSPAASSASFLRCSPPARCGR